MTLENQIFFQFFANSYRANKLKFNKENSDLTTSNFLAKNLHSVGSATLCNKSEVMLMQQLLRQSSTAFISAEASSISPCKLAGNTISHTALSREKFKKV